MYFKNSDSHPYQTETLIAPALQRLREATFLVLVSELEKYWTYIGQILDTQPCKISIHGLKNPLQIYEDFLDPTGALIVKMCFYRSTATQFFNFRSAH